MNATDPALTQALDLIGRDRLTEFFRLANQPGCVTAIELINESLDEGLSLEAIFAKDTDPLALKGGPYIQVDRVRKSTESFRINFGYSFGDCGDGGQWSYSFENGSPPAITNEGPRVMH